MARMKFTLWPWLIIFMMIASVIWMMNRLTLQLQQTDACKNNLETIYNILRTHESEHGQLPSFDMFSQDPLEDEESLPNLLKSYGFDPSLAICPASPQVLREHGLSYLWNSTLNQGSLMNRDEPTWVLVDVQALDDRIAGPHFGSYHILYSDGRVERTPHPPHTLPVQFD